MNSAIAERPNVDAGAIEQALVGGDLSKLTPQQRISYYNRVCESLGLNPLTKPFAYITLNGKLTLYALKDCTEQLRANKHVSVQIIARELVEDCYVVTARASIVDKAHMVNTATATASEVNMGVRVDESIGAVPLAGLKGEARANALMKAETKAKRRVTLSICGLGMLDETEVESIQPHGYSVEAPAQPVAPPLPVSGIPSVPNGGDSGASRFPLSTTQNTAQMPALPLGTVRIERVDHQPTKNANVVLHFVTLSSGEVLRTIKDQLAGLCEQLCQENIAVTVESKSTKWGPELVSVHRIPAPEFAPVEPVTSDEIPF